MDPHTWQRREAPLPCIWRRGARAGCRNCTGGFFDDDLDTTTPCAECPEGKDSEPGATECATSLAAEVEDEHAALLAQAKALEASLRGKIAATAVGRWRLRAGHRRGLRRKAGCLLRRRRPRRRIRMQSRRRGRRWWRVLGSPRRPSCPSPSSWPH